MDRIIQALLIASGLAFLVRAVAPWFVDAHWLEKKPLTCATCMAFWSTVIVWYVLRLPVVEATAAFGGTAVLLHLSSVFHPPIELP